MRNHVTGFFCHIFFSFLILWFIFLFNNKKGYEKYNKRYMKTWLSLVLVMREHEMKTKYILSINTQTNTYILSINAQTKLYMFSKTYPSLIKVMKFGDMAHG